MSLLLCLPTKASVGTFYRVIALMFTNESFRGHLLSCHCSYVYQRKLSWAPFIVSLLLCLPTKAFVCTFYRVIALMFTNESFRGHLLSCHCSYVYQRKLSLAPFIVSLLLCLPTKAIVGTFYRVIALMFTNESFRGHLLSCHCSYVYQRKLSWAPFIVILLLCLPTKAFVGTFYRVIALMFPTKAFVGTFYRVIALMFTNESFRGHLLSCHYSYVYQRKLSWAPFIVSLLLCLPTKAFVGTFYRVIALMFTNESFRGHLLSCHCSYVYQRKLSWAPFIVSLLLCLPTKAFVGTFYRVIALMFTNESFRGYLLSCHCSYVYQRKLSWAPFIVSLLLCLPTKAFVGTFYRVIAFMFTNESFRGHLLSYHCSYVYQRKLSWAPFIVILLLFTNESFRGYLLSCHYSYVYQ